MPPEEIAVVIKTAFSETEIDPVSHSVVIAKDSLVRLAGFLKNDLLAFDDLHCATVVDNKEAMELVYIFYSTTHRHQLTVKVRLGLQDLTVDSLTGLWKGADWFEREIYDMFGIVFINHPNLKRILNPDDWKGFPLRKDYSDPNVVIKPRF